LRCKILELAMSGVATSRYSGTRPGVIVVRSHLLRPEQAFQETPSVRAIFLLQQRRPPLGTLTATLLARLEQGYTNSRQ